MTQPLVSLAYRSLSTAPVVDSKTLGSILYIAQRNNIRDHLTGALAYGDGQFIQVLEGPQDMILRTMSRIRLDGRHHHLDEIGPSPITHRLFPDWCMAILTVEPTLRPVFSALSNDWEALGPRAAALLAASLND